MERRTFLKLAAVLPGLALAGCSGSKTLLSAKDPTMLSIWHMYGEQADSPMNRLLTEFNDTVGKEKGILLNVTNMTNSAAFDAIADYPFEQQSYQRLYDVYNEMRLQNTPLSEPGIVGYHAKAKALYDSLRQRQKDYPQRLANGETLEALTEETWQLLCDNA
mgnify:CR=1 FL=1